MGITYRQKVKGPGHAWHVFIHQNKTIRSFCVGDKKAAQAAAAELRRRIAAGVLDPVLPEVAPPPPPVKPTFKEFVKQYIHSYAKTKLKRLTWLSYECILERHLLPYWADKRIDEITRADVRALLLAKQAEGLALGTLDNIRVLISGLFTQAFLEDLITGNPAAKSGRYLKKTEPGIKPQFLSQDKTAAFLSYVEREHPAHYPLLLTAFRTGMRLGEVMGLAWEDIDFERRVIEVRRGYSHEVFDTPKSNKSRTIEISDDLVAKLQVYRRKLMKQFKGKLPAIEAPGTVPGQPHLHMVFPNERGGPQCGDNFRQRIFRPICKALGLPTFRFHDIRHTYASLLLQVAPIHFVKQQMGHASITTTVDVYGHVMPCQHRESLNFLDTPPAPSMKLNVNKGAAA